MNFLISNALAADAPATAQQPGGFSSLIFLGLMMVVFYFLLIRPQAKRAKEHKAMVDALAKGDEVVIGGGIVGRVTEIVESFITVEIAPGVEVKAQRAAVQTILPKGTLKSS